MVRSTMTIFNKQMASKCIQKLGSIIQNFQRTKDCIRILNFPLRIINIEMWQLAMDDFVLLQQQQQQ